MNFNEYKEKIFSERPGVKEEYDKISTEKVYVLGKEDPMFGDLSFYMARNASENPHNIRISTTDFLKDAGKYSFHDALILSRNLQKYGMHFRIILLDSLLQI